MGGHCTAGMNRVGCDAERSTPFRVSDSEIYSLSIFQILRPSPRHDTRRLRRLASASGERTRGGVSGVHDRQARIGGSHELFRGGPRGTRGRGAAPYVCAWEWTGL